MLRKQIECFINEIQANRVSIHAASASFFLLTSMLPLLMVLLAVLSWIEVDLNTEFTETMLALLPEALESVFYYVMNHLPAMGGAGISVTLIILIWAASNSMIGLVDGLNVINETEYTRSFMFKRAMCVVYTLVLMAGLLVTFGLRVFGYHILEFLQTYFPYVANGFSAILGFRGLMLFLVIAITIAAMYTFFPDKKMNFIRQLPGAIFASAAWLIFSDLYSLYVGYASSFSVLYSGLGIAILAMLWVYFCIYIIFFGAIINKLYFANWANSKE